MRVHPSVQYWNHRNVIAFAPDKEGADSGGGDTTQGGEGDDTATGGDGNDTANGGDGEINLDGAEAIAMLFSDDEKDEELLTTPPASLGIQSAEDITKAMEDNVKGISMPEGMIPADFNPADPKQMRKLLTDAMQLGARHILNASFIPIRNALKLQQFNTQKDVQTRLRSQTTRGNDQKTLEENIPAALDPENRTMVQTMFKRSQAKFPNNPKQAIAATKKALQAMNIDPMLAPKSKTNSSGSTGVKRGNDALDGFAPLATGPKGTASNLRR